MMPRTWQGEFLTYATLSASLVRTLDDECDHTLRLVEHIPSLTNAVMKIVQEGPIYEHMPQEHPLCDACRKKVAND